MRCFARRTITFVADGEPRDAAPDHRHDAGAFASEDERHPVRWTRLSTPARIL